MSANQFGHRLLRQLMQPGYRRFRQNRGRLEVTQRQRLAGIMARVARTPTGKHFDMSSRWQWDDFASRVPVSGYGDWKTQIETQMAQGDQRLIDSPVMRYQPTSGSSSAIKWIPYTRQFLNELDSAIAPWLGDLYARYPGIRQGAHYWSLSWLPNDMRQQGKGHINDDMKLLSTGKRWLAKHTQAVPENVSLAESSDDSLFASLAYLVARDDLSTISVWSPTFALGLFEKLALWRDELQEVLLFGNWPRHRGGFPGMTAPRSRRGAALLAAWDGRITPAFLSELWPDLALVSAWDTAAATPWAERLRELVPQAAFQGKGLWATEGVVTIPQGDDHVLAANSHVYEFEDVASGNILPPWHLEVGQDVVPLMTTGSGLLRYRLGDRMRVSGFSGQLPCLDFLGRDDGVDMVGEKMSTVAVQQLLSSLRWPAAVSPIVVLASEAGGHSRHPCYILLAESEPGTSAEDSERYARSLSLQLEDGLKDNFHYQLARNLGQLDRARCICGPDVHASYIAACRERGMIDGNIKVEALRSWRGSLPRQFAMSLAMEPREELV